MVIVGDMYWNDIIIKINCKFFMLGLVFVDENKWVECKYI